MKFKRNRLWLEILLALLLKIAVLSAIWIAWFSDPVKLDAGQMSRTLFSPQPAKESLHDPVPGTR